MRTFKNMAAVAVCAAALLAPVIAGAQMGYLDAFGPLRGAYATALPAATNFVVPAPSIVAFDMHNWSGVISVDISTITNVGAATNGWSVCPQVSPDETNWVTPPYAVGTSYTAFYTNFIYGTNFIATNTLVLPGTVTSASTAVAGAAVGGNAFLNYLAPALFTNTTSVSLTEQGDTVLGIPMNAASGPNRYLRFNFTNSTAADVSATNAHFSVVAKHYNAQ